MCQAASIKESSDTLCLRRRSGPLVAMLTVLHMRASSLRAIPRHVLVMPRFGQVPVRTQHTRMLEKRESDVRFTNVQTTKLVSYKKSYRNLEPASLMKKQNVPGPGSYPVIGIDKMGRYPVSTFKNSGAQTWSPAPTSRRSLRENLPGPGAHNVMPDSFSSSNYVLSNYKTLYSGKINPPQTSHSRNRSHAATL